MLEKPRCFGVSTLKALCLLLSVSVCLFLASCARPGQASLQVVQPARGATQQTILVVTTREPDKLGNNGFSSERAQYPTYLRMVVSVPPGHRPGTIEWPRGTPNAASSFAVIESKVISHEKFVDMAAAGRSALVFVHGYNNNFQESLFRLVQISADADARSTPILFAWPSREISRAISPTGIPAISPVTNSCKPLMISAPEKSRRKFWHIAWAVG